MSDFYAAWDRLNGKRAVRIVTASGRLVGWCGHMRDVEATIAAWIALH